jgi:phytoene synthase
VAVAPAPDRYAFAAGVVRERDRDRYFADLFIPEAARKHVLALHAFDAEIVRIRSAVSEPALGEIRQQWWRDVLSGEREGEENPVAEALLATLAAFRLPVEPLVALIDARTFDLYNDPMPTLADFEGYAGETVSVLFQFAAIILNGGTDPGAADAAGHAGVAMALTKAVKELPRDTSRRQLFLPSDRLEEHGVIVDELFAGRTTPGLIKATEELRDTARDHRSKALAAMIKLPGDVRSAFLPLALVDADLNRLDRHGKEPLRPLPEMAQWRRQWGLWRASRGWSK